MEPNRKERTDNPAPQRWKALSALACAVMILYVNTTALNVALPTLSTTFHATTDQMQWIVASYNLAFAAIILPSGRLGDRIGHRPVLIAGMIVFLAGSLLAACSDTVIELIAARAIMGLGASAFTPMSLAIIPALFSKTEQTKAMGIWTIATVLGVPLGPLVGGALLDTFGWQAIFWFNVAAVAVAIGFCIRFVPQQDRKKAGSLVNLPWFSMMLSTVGLVLFTWGMIDCQYSWTRIDAWAPAVVGIILMAWFVAIDVRSPSPLTTLALLKRNSFLLSALALGFCNFTMFGLLFILPNYLETILDNSGLVGGFMIMPMVAAAIAGAALSTRLSARMSQSTLIVCSLILSALGLFVANLTEPSSGYAPVALGLALTGLGMGAGQPVALSLGMSEVPSQNASSGSALLTAIRQVCSVMGIAIIGSIVEATYHTNIASMGSVFPTDASTSVASAFEIAKNVSGSAADQLRSAAAASYIAAMDHALIICSLLALALAIAAGMMLKRKNRRMLSAERNRRTL